MAQVRYSLSELKTRPLVIGVLLHIPLIRDATDKGGDNWSNDQELRRVVSDLANVSPEKARYAELIGILTPGLHRDGSRDGATPLFGECRVSGRLGSRGGRHHAGDNDRGVAATSLVMAARRS